MKSHQIKYVSTFSTSSASSQVHTHTHTHTQKPSKASSTNAACERLNLHQEPERKVFREGGWFLVGPGLTEAEPHRTPALRGGEEEELNLLLPLNPFKRPQISRMLFATARLQVTLAFLQSN